MATKTAPAPSNVRGGKVGTKIAVAAVVFIVVFVYGVGQGWWGAGPPSEEEETEQRRVAVFFEVVWGALGDTGEVFEETGRPIRTFDCVDRPLNITYYIDGEAHAASQHESDVDPGECRWKHHAVVPEGSELELRVEESGGGGYKICSIWIQRGDTYEIVLPNGIVIQPSGGDDCVASGIAL